MNPGPVLTSAVNVAEGRRAEVVQRIAAAAGTRAAVLDVSADADHNRSVLTMCGPATMLVEAILAAARVAVEEIDLRVHQGVHPRLGALDVVPFTPHAGASMNDAAAAARECARRLFTELAIPCFLYESSAPVPESARLPDVRRQAFRTLFPHVGGPEPHPSAGATVVGARGPLVAFNVNLASGDVAAARVIAAAIRSGELSLPGIRSLGLPLATRGLAQVSMNITRPEIVTVWDAYRRVEELARDRSVGIESSELIGVVHRAHLGTSDLSSLRLKVEPKTFGVSCELAEGETSTAS